MVYFYLYLFVTMFQPNIVPVVARNNVPLAIRALPKGYESDRDMKLMEEGADHNEEFLKRLEKSDPDRYHVLIEAMPYLKRPKKNFYESLYEPYWAAGDWVYYNRTTRVPRIITTTIRTSSTPAGQTVPTTTPTYVDMNCQHPCPILYRDFGVVCGKRFDGLNIELRQFKNACELYGANCIDPRPYGTYYKPRRRGEWRLLYRGPCYELTTPFIFPPSQIPNILGKVSSLAQYIHDMKGDDGFDFFKYTSTAHP